MRSRKDQFASLEAQHRATLESALDCIISMGPDGRVREFNPAAERVFGFSRDEAIGSELAQLIIPPALREDHRRGLAHYLRTGVGPVLGRRIEITAVRKDGTELLVELAITVYHLNSEPIFTAYLRDITERVRNDRRRTAQYTIASLLASASSIVQVGPKIIQTVAKSGEWVLGCIWVADASIAKDVVAVWHVDDRSLESFAEATRRINFQVGQGLPGRVVVSGRPVWIADVVNDENFPRKKFAAEADLHGAFAFPLFANEKVIGVLELFARQHIDPDEDLLNLMNALGSQIGLFIHRETIQRELQREKDAAEAANAAKDRFLATLSHELRTPLTPALIWAGATAKDPDVAPEIRDGLEMISRNIELEARLIDDLLDLTRIARGKIKLQLRRTDVHALMRHAVEIVRNEIESHNLSLQVALDADRTMVCVDLPRVQQIFWNVLRNAAKFTPSGGWIKVRSLNVEKDIVIEVCDSGVGIAEDNLTRIFNAFEQVNPEVGGVGLGLAISKAVAEMHGGGIRAKSEGRDRGACFLINLPTVD